MSLRSSYLSPEPEKEIRIWDHVLRPDDLPTATDETIARNEEEHLLSRDYDDFQEQVDESEDRGRSTDELPDLIVRLSDEDLDAVRRLVQQMLDEKDDPSDI